MYSFASSRLMYSGDCTANVQFQHLKIFFFVGEEVPKIGASGPKNGDECPCNWPDTLMEPSSAVFQISNSDMGP
jgi:hypothetical protein